MISYSCPRTPKAYLSPIKSPSLRAMEIPHQEAAEAIQESLRSVNYFYPCFFDCLCLERATDFYVKAKRIQNIQQTHFQRFHRSTILSCAQKVCLPMCTYMTARICRLKTHKLVISFSRRMSLQMDKGRQLIEVMKQDIPRDARLSTAQICT
jgi:hypothetical protein